jgi:hypothetical protein
MSLSEQRYYAIGTVALLVGLALKSSGLECAFYLTCASVHIVRSTLLWVVRT